jgi:hypothetical protein
MSDWNISCIAVPALKLGVHVLKTLWKFHPCGKCNAPTLVGHMQQQISLRKVNSSKILHVTKIFPVPPPACNNIVRLLRPQSLTTQGDREIRRRVSLEYLGYLRCTSNTPPTINRIVDSVK